MRSTTAVAAVHSMYTVVLISLLAWVTSGSMLGVEFDPVSVTVRLYLVMIVASLISLVVATAVNEFVRLNDDLTGVAATAEHRAVQLRAVTETIPDALVTVTADGNATALNAGGVTFVRTGEDGRQRVIMPQDEQWTRIPAEDIPSARALRGETVRAQNFLHADASGEERAFELSASPLVPDGGEHPDRALLLIRDVTDHHRVMRELEMLAESDPLTGLLNRRRFERELICHHGKHRLDGRGGGVLVLDLDGFKDINDTFGHAAGDEILKGVASILAASTGPSDLITRLGGDEFAILMPRADRDRVQCVADLLVERVRDYARSLDGAKSKLSVSIGGATFEAADEQGVDAVVAADRLMYDVKNTGCDGVMVVGRSEGPRERTRTRVEWKNRLERALEAD
ncbi:MULTISPECIES: GGDEF domain-containing protein [Dietzia]|uniref:GGDEF domain-containing protein n=1 Tax=Dietzia TaxID=37914 RepID=UPI0013E9C3DF|nr:MULTISPECIES: sensor domain-containing diguanylate cyclase [Dietzia]MCT1710452.1 GGDEF domain-containing protein [Dietzia cinnamea]MCT2273320.1 GGDEF domain-containing protein [Dietzia cinnamea]